MHGGYGCPMPELNGHVRLNPVIARSLGYADCYGDLLWRDAKCIVEYTSEQHHTGYRKQARDEMRRAALEAMGYRVFLLTKPQLHNQVAFEGFARAVLRAIGKRMPRRSLEYQSAQYELAQKPALRAVMGDYACMSRSGGGTVRRRKPATVAGIELWLGIGCCRYCRWRRRRAETAHV